MNLTEPTRATRLYLEAKAGTNAKLRKLVKSVSHKQRKAAIARASMRNDKQREYANAR